MKTEAGAMTEQPAKPNALQIWAAFPSCSLRYCSKAEHCLVPHTGGSRSAINAKSPSLVAEARCAVAAQELQTPTACSINADSQGLPVVPPMPC